MFSPGNESITRMNAWLNDLDCWIGENSASCGKSLSEFILPRRGRRSIDQQ